MNRSNHKALFPRALTLFLLVLMGVATLVAQKKQDPKDASSELSFTVLKETSGKPVKYASVILHPVNKDGSQGGGGMQSKTTDEGKVSFPGIPYGKVRVQVIAKGFQTYGEDFDVKEPAQEFTIKLKPPQDQYSIYK